MFEKSGSSEISGSVSSWSSADAPRAASPKPHVAKTEKLPPLEGTGAKTARPKSNRRVGDVAVHRYSGSFRAQPVTVTEEVVAREGNVLVVDYTAPDPSPPSPAPPGGPGVPDPRPPVPEPAPEI